MRKIIVILSFIICLCFTGSASAEVVSYSDEYAEFEYDNDFMGIIVRYERKTSDGNGYIRYTCEPGIKNDQKNNMAGAHIGINNYGCNIESDLIDNLMQEESNPEEILDIECLLINDQIYAVKENYSINGENDNVCDTFYNSFKLKDIDPEALNGNDDFSYDYIYKNVRYSELAVIYAQTAIDACNDYFALKITKEELANIFSQIEQKAEDLKDNSDYIYDIDLYLAIYVLSFNDDSEILEARKQLEEIVNTGADK